MKYGPGNLYELDIGTVFSANGSRWWKVTGYSDSKIGRNYWDTATYRVIKCNKSGKEFRETTGFFAHRLHQLLSEDQLTIAGVFKESTKVSTTGKETGIKKRRIQWLKATIADYQAELERLEKEIE